MLLAIRLELRALHPRLGLHATRLRAPRVELGATDDFPWIDIDAGAEAQPYPGAAMTMKPSASTLARVRSSWRAISSVAR